ncbi:MAG: diacylglycerol kinase family protein [Anaerolineae bacterium]|nr:diacylglycerol kinase family protein [Anaerolineae bacterium]
MRCRTLWSSFAYALAGLGYALRTQRNMRIHVLIAAAVCGLGMWLRLPAGHWAVIALTVGFVLVVESLNTVIELLIDLVSPEFHPLAKAAKDVSAGAVLLAALSSVVVGLCLLGPPLWERLFGGVWE